VFAVGASSALELVILFLWAFFFVSVLLYRAFYTVHLHFFVPSSLSDLFDPQLPSPSLAFKHSFSLLRFIESYALFSISVYRSPQLLASPVLPIARAPAPQLAA
jgi:hypothetical protein